MPDVRQGRPSALELAGLLEVTCWCETLVVPVPRADVLAGRTHSCGSLYCIPGCASLSDRREPVGYSDRLHGRMMNDRARLLRRAA